MPFSMPTGINSSGVTHIGDFEVDATASGLAE